MKDRPLRKYVSVQEALARLQRYCAYQDRCHQEVRHKLLALGIYGNDLEEIMVELIRENFLNEERFAKSFARGKFRMKNWGRNRIVNELKRREISAYCIRKAIAEIDEEEYMTCLQSLLQRKASQILDDQDFSRKTQLAQYAIGKGFEPQLVWEMVQEL